MAADALIDYPRLPMGADQIILQHHGMTNGQGFAVNFKDDISPLAKVMIIAEGFTEELLRTLEGTTEEKLTKKEIIKALHVKFPRHTYKKIIETLSELKF